MERVPCNLSVLTNTSINDMILKKYRKELKMDKKLVIENAAKELAVKYGAINITRKSLCDHVGIADGSFQDIMDESFTDFISRLDLPMGASVERKRVVPELRRKHVLNACIELAKTKGYNTLTRDAVATAAGVSPALISHYFGGITSLRAVILKIAIKREVLEIIAQGLVCGDPIAIQAPAELKRKAVNRLVEL